VSAEFDVAVCEAAVRLGWLSRERLDEAIAAGDVGAYVREKRWLTDEQIAHLASFARDFPADDTGVARIGRYEVRGLLGVGAMARVLRAYDPSLRREVALKLTAGVATPRAEREALAMARLNHPGIATVYDVGQERGSLYLAMELVEGRSLQKAWTDWPLRRRVEALRQAADAVGYAHARGVVHRDIKPENIMVGADGAVKVLDFGLARVEGEASMTRTGTAVGSPIYMSPEQVRGDAPSPATDVWALGVILYEALARRTPFDGATVGDVYRRVLDDDPVPPRRLNPSAPRDLELVCLCALEKHPAHRYATARDLAEDLSRWLDGAPVRVRPSSLQSVIARRIRRHPLALAGTAIVVLLVAAGIAAVAAVSARAGRERAADDLVLRASLAFARGDFATAREHLDGASRLVRDHAGARYWRGRLDLKEYQRRRPLPDVAISRGLLGLAPPAPETPEQRALRDSIAAAFRGGATEVFAAGVLAMWDGRPKDALDAFARAAPADADEAALLSAQCLYALSRFAEAHDRLAPLVRLEPRAALALWARILLARALQEELTGGACGEWFAAADEASVALKVAVDADEGAVFRARVHVEWALADFRAGRDPQPQLDRALEFVRGATAEAHLVRGDARLTRALWLASRGKLETRDPPAFREALDAYGQAVAAAPDFAPAYLRRATAALKRWSYLSDFRNAEPASVTSALADYERAEALSHGHAEARLGRARARGILRRGDEVETGPTIAAFEEEVAAIQAVIDAEPRSAAAWVQRGEVQGTLAEFKKQRGKDPMPEARAAIEAFSRATALEPRSSHVLRSRAVAHAFTGDYPAAEEDLRHAAALSDDAEVSLARGTLWRVMARARGLVGDEGHTLCLRALEENDRAVRLNPDALQVHYERSFALRELGDSCRHRGQDPTRHYEEALAELERVVEINPKHHDAFRVMSMLHLRLTARARDPEPSFRAALEAVDRGLAIDPSFRSKAGGYLLQRGVVLCEYAQHELSKGRDPAERLTAAVEALTDGVAINPRNWDYRRWRARANFLLGVRRARDGQDPTAPFEAAIADLDFDLAGEPENPAADVWRQERAMAREALDAWRRK
jgi:serine/threonine-protein kinase